MLKAVLETQKNETLDIAGPKRFRFSEIVEIYLKATNDPHTIISDSNAHYFGAKLNDNTLVPQKNAYVGSIDFENWFNNQREPK